MISVDHYQALIFEQLHRLETETIPLGRALHRTLRAAVASSVNLPPWPNSAMDGYAVRLSDLSEASPESVCELPVVADIAAGDTREYVLAPGTTMRIMTGAPVPTGCDAVVPLEATTAWVQGMKTADAPLPAVMGFAAAVNDGQNIRPRGDDIHAGDQIAAAGEVLTPNRLAACAAAGTSDVVVSRIPKVAIISTGTELVPAGHELAFGQIYDSNGPLLTALVTNEHVEVVSCRHVEDDAQALLQAVTSAQQMADVIILTGGASVGAYDTSRLVLDGELRGHEPLACDELRSIRFHQVAMQPGKPQGFGALSDGTVVWSLPGNPVSVWVSYFVFIEPALRKLQGRENYLAPWQHARASEGFRSPLGREQFMPVVLEYDETHQLTAAPAARKGSGSHLAASLGQATGVARVSATMNEVQPGDSLLVRGI